MLRLTGQEGASGGGGRQGVVYDKLMRRIDELCEEADRELARIQQEEDEIDEESA